ncbi:unnamed protein product, partial [Mycena citricolor]
PFQWQIRVAAQRAHQRARNGTIGVRIPAVHDERCHRRAECVLPRHHAPQTPQRGTEAFVHVSHRPVAQHHAGQRGSRIRRVVHVSVKLGAVQGIDEDRRDVGPRPLDELVDVLQCRYLATAEATDESANDGDGDSAARIGMGDLAHPYRCGECLRLGRVNADDANRRGAHERSVGGDAAARLFPVRERCAHWVGEERGRVNDASDG